VTELCLDVVTAESVVTVYRRIIHGVEICVCI